jgi:hypothetical protein
MQDKHRSKPKNGKRFIPLLDTGEGNKGILHHDIRSSLSQFRSRFKPGTVVSKRRVSLRGSYESLQNDASRFHDQG